MPFVFSNLNVSSQGGDSNSVVSIAHLESQNFISTGSMIDTSLNSIKVNKIIQSIESNNLSLSKNCSIVSGSSNVLPDGDNSMIGFEKVLVNNNNNAFTSIISGAFSETPGLIINASAYDNSGNIYIGGTFQTFRGIVVNNIVRCNTDGTISRCGMGLSAGCTSLLWDPSYNRLYVGYSGTVVYNLNGTSSNLYWGAVVYNPSSDTWSGFGSSNGGFSTTSTNAIYLIDYVNNFLYVANEGAGSSVSLGGSAAKLIARVNRANLTSVTSLLNTSVFPLGSSTQIANNPVHCMLLDLSQNAMYVGGGFNGTNGRYNCLIKIDLTTVPSSTVSVIGGATGAFGTQTGGVWYSPTIPRVRTMVRVGDDIYFGGAFDRTPSNQYTSPVYNVGQLSLTKSLQRLAKFNVNTLEISPVNINDYISHDIYRMVYDSDRNKIAIVGQMAYVGQFETRGIVWYDISSSKYEQLTYGFNIGSGTTFVIQDIYIRNNKYIISGGYNEATGNDNGLMNLITELDPANINIIYGSIMNNGQELSSIHLQYKGQMLRLIWNGSRWCLDNYLKI